MFGIRGFSVEDFLADRGTFDMMKDWEDLEYRDILANDYSATACLSEDRQETFRLRLRNASAIEIFRFQADLNVMHKNKFPLTLKLAQLIMKHFNTANVSTELFLRALLGLPGKETRKLLAKARKFERELKKQGKGIALGQPVKPAKLDNTKQRSPPATSTSAARLGKRGPSEQQYTGSPSRNQKNVTVVGKASSIPPVDGLIGEGSDREGESFVSEEQESSEDEEQEPSESNTQDLTSGRQQNDPAVQYEELPSIRKQESSSGEESASELTDPDRSGSGDSPKNEEHNTGNGSQQRSNSQKDSRRMIKMNDELHIDSVTVVRDEGNSTTPIHADSSSDASASTCPASPGDTGNATTDVEGVVFGLKANEDFVRSRRGDSSAHDESLRKSDNHKTEPASMRSPQEPDTVDKLQPWIEKSKTRRNRRKGRMKTKSHRALTHQVQSGRVEKRLKATGGTNWKHKSTNSGLVRNDLGNLQNPQSINHTLKTSSLPAASASDLEQGHWTKQTQSMNALETGFRLKGKAARKFAKKQKHGEIEASSREIKGVMKSRDLQDNQSSVPRKRRKKKSKRRRSLMVDDYLLRLAESVSPHEKHVQLSTPSITRNDPNQAEAPLLQHNDAIVSPTEAGNDQNILFESQQRPNTTIPQDSGTSIPTNYPSFTSVSSSSPVQDPVFSPALLCATSRSDSSVSSHCRTDHGVTNTSLATSLATQDKLLGEDDVCNIDRFVENFLAEDSLDNFELDLHKPVEAMLPVPQQAVPQPTVVKTVKSHTSEVSPHFVTPPRRKRSTPQSTPKSCIPFPSLKALRFGLIQEQLSHNPFQLVLAVTLLNCTKATVALPVFFSLIEKYPTPTLLAAAPLEEIVAMTQHLGFQHVRAKTLLGIAQTWLDAPPAKGRRHRMMHYPNPGDGKTIKPGELLDDDDVRSGAFEIAHIHGAGPYALDSWRIFCRDRLRGLADGWDGEGANEDFEPEWMRVLPKDKELRAFLRWKWLKEGVLWNCETGEVGDASESLVAAAEKDGFLWEDWEEKPPDVEPSCDVLI